MTPTPQTLARDDITALNADDLSRAIRTRAVSCTEVMQAYLARIHRLNPACNAIVNLAGDDTLLAQAAERDAEIARGQWRGWLHGMPQAIKDTGHALGFPTTYGCALLRDSMPTRDSVMTARMKAAGCVVIGKTNMPQLGLGSHTFNELFGVTRNAWDPAVSAGGSSGGAAVALAHRLLPVADGSDFMGSLRNPAAWNHVFGLRPSQGRIPYFPSADVWISQLGIEGPMARTAADLTRLLELQSGHDRNAPLSIRGGFGPVTLAEGTQALKGLRVGWLANLGGHLAMEDGILACNEQALKVMAAHGAQVQPLAPAFDPQRVWEAWLVWRRALVAPRVAALLSKPDARELLKPEALWEHDQALSLSFLEFNRASETRSQFHAQILSMFDQCDVLALPTTQCWPFPTDWRWPRELDGRHMDTYHRWMESTIYATFAGLPALSMPAGFHSNGKWPAGLQLIGPPQDEARLLNIAAAYETAAADLMARRPPEPAG